MYVCVCIYIYASMFKFACLLVGGRETEEENETVLCHQLPPTLNPSPPRTAISGLLPVYQHRFLIWQVISVPATCNLTLRDSTFRGIVWAGDNRPQKFEESGNIYEDGECRGQHRTHDATPARSVLWPCSEPPLRRVCSVLRISRQQYSLCATPGRFKTS